ncbi:hypothetical protein ACH5RR_025761 [Cinchona calisaya]|uniref:Uncharacterized protein n=1 Tax=Cinchona calisaya TaxID=153742 RepID=A0ABD2Z0J6_9GENT
MKDPDQNLLQNQPPLIPHERRKLLWWMDVNPTMASSLECRASHAAPCNITTTSLHFAKNTREARVDDAESCMAFTSAAQGNEVSYAAIENEDILQIGRGASKASVFYASSNEDHIGQKTPLEWNVQMEEWKSFSAQA